MDREPMHVLALRELNARELPPPLRLLKIRSGIRHWITRELGWLAPIAPEMCHLITLRGRVTGYTQYIDALVEADDEVVSIHLRVSEHEVPDLRNSGEECFVMWRWVNGACVDLDCPEDYFEWVIALPWLAANLREAIVARADNERKQLAVLAEIEAMGTADEPLEELDDDLGEDDYGCEGCGCQPCQSRFCVSGSEGGGRTMTRAGKKVDCPERSLCDHITANAVAEIVAANSRLREGVLSAFAVYDAELSRLFNPTREVIGWVFRDDESEDYFGAGGWEEKRSRAVPFSSPAVAREALAEFFKGCGVDPTPATLVRVWRKKKVSKS